MLSGLSTSMWLLFLFFLEYGRNGKICLNQRGTKEMPTEHRCLGRLVFSCYIYFRLLAVMGRFFAGCVKREPKAVLQKLAGSFL